MHVYIYICIYTTRIYTSRPIYIICINICVCIYQEKEFILRN